MTLLKRFLNFNRLIFLIVAGFIGYQIGSLYQIEIIYVSSLELPHPIVYLIASIVIILCTILVIYFLPIVFVVETYRVWIQFGVKCVLPHLIRRIKHSLKVIRAPKQKYYRIFQVIRC
jgi:hypothetical protein